ncbi:DUF3048 domain-containing protein [Fictibacillus phosphorivorans]|uniref:DUF3048 domain-containing protein n=1 Tax=Fictibacillus phosphorivorans TaxID=1221500 RepID=UPI0020401D60|nr:DUF3048 domain-containing protein [Fictibacillus phosphorivorans]MCM3720184.1 DUF3048 domain-containing protein [Fictibacillus phosphorivorans]MCM3777874.1 DUF3048 domain-containing protein [Fictibacillus phosphorivorans]
MKKWYMIFMSIILVFSLSACKDTKDKVIEDGKLDKTEASDKKKDKKKETFSSFFPLTGIGTNDEVDHRAVAVMVNNHWKARPQSGLHKADIVYEVLAEGELTRFLAIFQSEIPETVGPVRSARDYYIELAQGYNAFYVAHGYSPEAKQMLYSGTIEHLNGMDYDGSLFKRASFRKAPHNSYITSENLLKGMDKVGADRKDELDMLPFLTKKSTVNLEGEPAKQVLVDYGRGETVGFTYSEEEKTYARNSNNEPTIDRETETPITVSNVFIVEAAHRVIDDAGRREINLTSGGDAILIQNGVAQRISWKNDNGRIVPDGGAFLPGKTWINIVPSGMESSVKMQ